MFVTLMHFPCVRLYIAWSFRTPGGGKFFFVFLVKDKRLCIRSLILSHL